MSITIQQIEAFIVVAEYLNLSAAADTMFISHSALSKVIKRFESSLGVKLFTRKNRGMSLTPEGHSLYETLYEPYSGVRAALALAKDSDHAKRPKIRLGFPDSYYYISYYNVIKDAVAQFIDKYPNIEITETIYGYDALLMSLISKETDIIIGQAVFLERLRGAEVVSLLTSYTYIVISNNHPHASKDELSFEQLCNETLYAIRSGDGVEQKKNLETLCKCLKFAPREILLVPNTFTLLHAINAGKGIAFFAKLDNIVTNMALRFYPFPEGFEYAAEATIGAAWFPRGESNEMQYFLDILKNVAQESKHDRFRNEALSGRSREF